MSGVNRVRGLIVEFRRGESVKACLGSKGYSCRALSVCTNPAHRHKTMRICRYEGVACTRSIKWNDLFTPADAIDNDGWGFLAGLSAALPFAQRNRLFIRGGVRSRKRADVYDVYLLPGWLTALEFIRRSRSTASKVSCRRLGLNLHDQSHLTARLHDDSVNNPLDPNLHSGRPRRRAPASFARSRCCALVARCLRHRQDAVREVLPGCPEAEDRRVQQ